MYNKLDFNQKCSFLAMLYVFGQFARPNIWSMRRAKQYLKLLSSELGVSVDDAKRYLENHGQFQGVFLRLMTIKDDRFIERLMFGCFILCNLAPLTEKKSEAISLLFDTFCQFGYTEDEIKSMLEKNIRRTNLFGWS